MKRSISFRPTLLALVLATNFPVAHAAVPKDMLVIGKAADPQTLDPAVTIDNNDWTVTYPSYQRLVQYKTDCNFAFFSGLIGAQFWAERAQPKSPELDAKLLVSC